MDAEETVKEDRRRVQDVLQGVRGHTEVEDRLEGSIVTKWIVVSERMSPDGDRWLCRLNGEAMTAWDTRGMLHEALFGDWDDV